jgi:hypothetical protein
MKPRIAIGTPGYALWTADAACAHGHTTRHEHLTLLRLDARLQRYAKTTNQAQPK